MNYLHTESMAAKRHRAITQQLRIEDVVRVDELAKALEVSAATIRRDLVELEKNGVLKRVHGGAVPAPRNLDEPLFDAKAAINNKQKQWIADLALSQIGPGDSVFLDGGSTVLALAQRLPRMTDLTVVTNSLRVASLLSGSGPRMIMVGGDFRRLSQVFVGALSRPMLDTLHVDCAFMGTIGLDMEEGMTTTDPREALTKELVIENASRVVLLADSSKFNSVSFVRFAGVEDIDAIITDPGAPQTTCELLEQANVTVITGAEEPDAVTS